MDWLDNLGKDLCLPGKPKKIKYLKKQLDHVKEYKANYYIKNIEIYRERNRAASKKKTEERLNKLVDDDVVHKLKYVLEN